MLDGKLVGIVNFGMCILHLINRIWYELPRICCILAVPCAVGMPDGFAKLSYLYQWVQENKH